MIYMPGPLFRCMVMDDFLHKQPTNLDPKAGHLLLAEPMMSDPNFSRTAVLIIEHEADEGQLGLVLNRELDIPVDVLLDGWLAKDKMNLFNGGPVEIDQLLFLHRLGDVIDDCYQVMPGLWTGGNMDQLHDYLASGGETEGVIRIFVGYSGWIKGQLTAEILQNSWGVNTNPDVRDLLRGSGEEYWRREVGRLGPDYRSWLSIPQHPSLN